MKKITNEDLMKEIIKLNQNLDTLAKQEGHLPVWVTNKKGKIKKKITTLNELTKENKKKKVKYVYFMGELFSIDSNSKIYNLCKGVAEPI